MLRSKLSELVKSNNISQAEFEALACQLSPQQERLFLYLSEHGVTDTIELRMNCSIGNVSEAAHQLNKRLLSNGLSKMVICTLKPHQNVFGQKGSIGVWSLVSSTSSNDSK